MSKRSTYFLNQNHSFTSDLIFGVIAFSLFSSNIGRAIEPELCPDLTQIRGFYTSGQTDAAFQGIACLKRANPSDASVRRASSDLYWWGGNVDAAILDAREGFALSRARENSSSFDEDRIHLQDRLAPWTFVGSYSHLESNNQTGQDAFVLGDFRYYEKNHFQLGYFKTARIFAGTVAVSDWRLESGAVFVLNKISYLEARAEYSPYPVFSPNYYFSVAPHIITLDGSDLSLNLRFNQYNPGNVFVVTPAWLRTFAEDWTLGAQVSAIHTYHWIFASAGFIDYVFSSRLRLRLTGAAGRAVEGPGLEGTFESIGINLRFRITPEIAILPQLGRYSGSVRSENSTGLNVELRL